MDTRHHWDAVYQAKSDADVSWFEAIPDVSIRMLERAGIGPHSCVVDIGGGESRLVDALVGRGFTCVAVLDIAGAALTRARQRLGTTASDVTWVETDVTADWTLKPMDAWHDRAVFHFLTAADQRTRYLTHLRNTLKMGGSAVLAIFALDGPEKCSGLPVARYSPDTLSEQLGSGFELVESTPHLHHTPWGATQSFQYSRFVRVQ